MTTICIFNPEHDLCLANGDRHFMPPQSALQLGSACKEMMRWLYPNADVVVATADLLSAAPLAPYHGTDCQIIAWGWNSMIVQQLLKQGFTNNELPTHDYIAQLRRLQHRATIAEQQPDTLVAQSLEEVQQKIAAEGEVVAKAPWSGSGRGLRWISGTASDHDIRWLQKVLREQQCVVVEPRRKVVADFALEYCMAADGITFEGYSLFENQNGVYRHNLLWSDEQIEAHLNTLCDDLANCKQRITTWLQQHLCGKYYGALGVDLFVDQQRRLYVSEINLRHTMGLVAHRYLQARPEKRGKHFGIQHNPQLQTEAPYQIFIQ